MPYYRHDCMNPHCCRYVGSTPFSDSDCFDVYAYKHGESMIIRHSSEEGDYRSMPVSHYRESRDSMVIKALALFDDFFAPRPHEKISKTT
jgi:hypothetical protein